jgi:hypothetical protein
MAQSFDSTNAVRFELRRGAVFASKGDERLLLVPAGALAELVRSAQPEAAAALGRALGTAIGRRAIARIEQPTTASVEQFVTQLAGECALGGVGSLTIERWGRAMVLLLEGSPLDERLLSPLLSAALEAATGRPSPTLLLGRDGEVVRVLVASEAAVERARDWLAGGTAWGDVLTKLHARPA